MSASVSVAPNLLAAGFGAQPGQKTAGAGGAMAAGFEALLGALITGEPAEQPGQGAATPAATTMATAAATIPVQAKTADADKADDDLLMDDDAATADTDPQAALQPDLLLAGLVAPMPAPPQAQTAPVTDTAPEPAPAIAQAAAPKIDLIPSAAPAPEPAAAAAAAEPAAMTFTAPTEPQGQADATPVFQPTVFAERKPAASSAAATAPAAVAQAEIKTPAAERTPAAAPEPAASVQAAPAAQAHAPAPTVIPAPVQAQAAEVAAIPAAAKAPAPKEEPAVEATPAAEPARARKAAAPQAGGEAVSATKSAQTGVAAPVVGDEGKTDTAKENQPDVQGQAAPAAASAPAAQAHATQAAATVRGAPETVAHLAAQIVKKLDGRSTRFDVALNPIGLGHVDVRVEIAADGKISGALAFDNPQAAAELRARSQELTKALEQAGLDLSGGLSFDVASDQGRQNGRGLQQDDSGAAFRGRAFQAALEANDAADAAAPALAAYSRRAATGVDVRI